MIFSISFLKRIIGLLLFIILCSCNQTLDRNETFLDSSQSKLKFNEDEKFVKVMNIEKGPFNLELISNGIVHSTQKTELNFHSNGFIKKIFVNEGDFVRQGSLIAQLEDFQENLDLEEAKIIFQKSKLEFEDQLLQVGYRLIDTTKINDTLLYSLKLKSGLISSIINLEKSKRKISDMSLLAPFDGKIAELIAQQYNHTNNLNFICKIINENSLEVEFKLLELEIQRIKINSNILIETFNKDSEKLKGYVTSINPVVDDKGLINVKARILDPKGLMEGMGVKVTIHETIQNQISVPKSAVVERDGKSVLFTFRNNRSFWNYVEILFENSSSYAITGINEGDQVIYDGNFNLAHDKAVKTETD